MLRGLKLAQQEQQEPFVWPPCCSVATRHRIRKYPDSTVSTYPKRYRIQKFPLWRAVSKVSGFAGRIHRMRVDERRIRKEKFADSKVFGYVWTGPKPWTDFTRWRHVWLLTMVTQLISNQDGGASICFNFSAALRQDQFQLLLKMRKKDQGSDNRSH